MFIRGREELQELEDSIEDEGWNKLIEDTHYKVKFIPKNNLKDADKLAKDVG